MTNYIIESDIDFFEELSKMDNDELDNLIDSSKCLLTDSKLIDNYIKLSCNHSFNYKALFKELHANKYITNKGYFIENNIKCPYCRTISNFVLPFIPSENSDDLYSKRLFGINHPAKFCLKLHECQWSGTKNKSCKHPAYINSNGTFCYKHHKIIHNRNKIKSIQWTDKMLEISKKMTVKQLQEYMRLNNLRIGGTKVELLQRYVANT